MHQRRNGRPHGDSPIYASIAAQIGKQLSAGDWPPGQRVPSYRHFAKRFGVSVKTIQRALAILKVEGRLCVRPDRPTVAAIGASLSSIVEDSVVLVLRSTLGELMNGWAQEMIRGVMQGVQKTGYTLIVLQHSSRWRREFPAGLRDLPLKGVLLMGPLIPDLLKQYETLGHPVVLLDQPVSECQLHSVSVANFEAAFDATMRMIARRHRKIAFINYFLKSIRNVDPDARERQAGFLAACREAGLNKAQYKVFMAGLDGRSAAVTDVVRSGFTAVLTANNYHANQIESVASESRLKIPKDLSVITFRTSAPLERDWTGPQTDFTEFGRLGMRILERRPSTVETVRLKTQWNEGNSLGSTPLIKTV